MTTTSLVLLVALLLTSTIHADIDHCLSSSSSPSCLRPFVTSLARDFYVIERLNKGQDGLLHPPRTHQQQGLMGPSHLHEINHYIYGGNRDWSQPFKALVIYRGTGGHAALMLISQLMSIGNPYQVVIASTSYEEAMEIHQLVYAWALEHMTNMSHVVFLYGHLAAYFTDQYGTFDYIDMSDLHRIEQDDSQLLETLKLVHGLLKPGGGLGMVIKTPWNAQQTQRLLSLNPNVVDQLLTIPVTDPSLAWASGNASRVLREFVDVLGPAYYGNASWLLSPMLAANNSCSNTTQKLYDHVEGEIQEEELYFHELYAIKPQEDPSGTTSTTVMMPPQLTPEAVPVVRNREAAQQLIYHRWEETKLVESPPSPSSSSSRMLFSYAFEFSSLYIPLPPPRPAGGPPSSPLLALILYLMDGTSDLRSIYTYLKDQHLPGLTWSDYWTQVEWLYEVLHSLGWMFLSSRTLPPFRVLHPHMRNESIHKPPPPLSTNHNEAATPPRLATVPCSPPHCHFQCYDPPPGHPPLTCDSPPFDWVTKVLDTSSSLTRHCHTPDGRPYMIYPISFAIPKEDVVDCVPRKVKDFATVVPGKKDTYIFTALYEAEYKRDYRMAYYAKTTRKAGWDCLRHYEILASGSVPYFPLLEESPQEIMTSLPKDLIIRARDLPGVTREGVDKQLFNQTEYHELACQLLDHTRKHLTTEALAKYVLEVTGNEQAKNVLFLSYEQETDYLRDNMLHGLVKYLGPQGGVVTDIPKIQHDYMHAEEQPVLTGAKLYGHGFSYAHRLVDDPRVDRTRIVERIKAHEFDVVIYGSVHRGLLYWQDVVDNYGPESVIYLDGEDYYHEWSWITNRVYFVLGTGHYFKREMHPGCPPPPPEATVSSH